MHKNNKQPYWDKQNKELEKKRKGKNKKKQKEHKTK